MLTIKQIQNAIDSNGWLRKYRNCPYCNSKPKYFLIVQDKNICQIRISCEYCNSGRKPLIRELNAQETFILQCLI